MNLKLKDIKDQVFVITGSSSGIGLATAKMALERGAKVVLSSRNGPELRRIADELSQKFGSGRVIAVECDVADPQACERLARSAIKAFGRFDTWVNNAGLSIYGKLEKIPLEEKRKLFDVNFWGVVHGCRAAIPQLKKSGGALINIGSIASERAVPLQGAYSASKHAVKAYTDSLRMELEADKYPVSVSLVMPAAIDTPFTEHAVSHLGGRPQHRAPVYAPEVVAEAILECAHTPKRDIYVGGSAKFYSLMETFMPRLADMFMEKFMTESDQVKRTPPSEKEAKAKPALYGAKGAEGEIHGSYPGHVAKSSAYTKAAMHPAAAALIATGLGVAAAVGFGFLQRSRASQASREFGAAQGLGVDLGTQTGASVH